MPTIFLYRNALGPADYSLFPDARPATVRGHLWRGPRNRTALVPDDTGPPISGFLVEVEPARLRVLDWVEGEPLHRQPIIASAHLHVIQAEAYVLDRRMAARSGFRPAQERR